MKTQLGFLLSLVLLVAPGCCTTRDAETSVSVDSYKAAITRVRDNLKNNIRPSVSTMLDADAKHGAEWKAAKLGLIDDTITLCEDTLAGKNAGVAAPSSATGGNK